VVQPARAEGGLGGCLASVDGHPTAAIDHRPAGFWKGLATLRWPALDLQEIHPRGPIQMKERRSFDREWVAKGALLFFSERTGVHSCCVRDITKSGAGIRTQNLPILPLNFLLSFDNFRTARQCQMIWRDNDFLGVKFDN